ncbi:f-box domain-containing protein [Moniliophthora roreri MCA 2997]|uniref:F-box domain-containing protein n=2 Tax=Moniliophthora roreri TaxID=221103 RepID=V2YGV6_MONRO|nr:f-box domain-containing protein [Moniliophthora roreri MCA 2997]
MTSHLQEFLEEAPAEIVLYIFSYLDLPDLAILSQLSARLAILTSDPALHKNRLRIIAPSRVQHSLFAQGPQGISLRPTILDLVHRGVVKGLGIERRWRDGSYFYSQRSIMLYEASIKLSRRHAGHVVSTVLRQRTQSSNDVILKTLHATHVLPEECSSLRVSRILLPVMRKLQWSFQRDKLSRSFRDGTVHVYSMPGKSANFGKWAESRGKGIVQDGERVRLALCPGDVRKKVGFYESL